MAKIRSTSKPIAREYSRSITILLLLVPILVTFQNSYAKTDTLYQGRVTILNESDEKRNEAIEAALRQVLGKLLSKTDRANLELIHQITKNAPQFVQQYRFINPQATDSVGKRLVPKTILVKFDPVALNQSLQLKGLKVWADKRPQTLVWLALQEKNQGQLFSAELTPTLATKVTNAADNRGLPIYFPLMDLTDRLQIKAEDIISTSADKILLASQRYGAQSVLAGTLSKAPKRRWTSTWQLFDGQSTIKWRDEKARPLVQALNSAFDRLFDNLHAAAATTKNTSIKVDNDPAVIITITGIRNLRETKRVGERLKSLPQVSSIEWRGMKAKAVKFRLIPKDRKSALISSLSTLTWLEKRPQDNHHKEGLNFRLIDNSQSP